ncbi:MAG TPA: DUF6531 domain-containing protein, partial [Gammaproteobacteria bacterium]
MGNHGRKASAAQAGRVFHNILSIFSVKTDAPEARPGRLWLAWLPLCVCLFGLSPVELKAETYISPIITPWEYFSNGCDYDQEGPFGTEAAAQQWGLDYIAQRECGSAWIVDPGHWGTPESPTSAACGGHPWAYPEHGYPDFPEIEVANSRPVGVGYYSANLLCNGEGESGFWIYRLREVRCPQGSVPDNGQCRTDCTCGQALINGQCVDQAPVYQTQWQDNGDLWVYPHGEGNSCPVEHYPQEKSDCQVNVGNPISCASGIKTQIETDYRGAGPDPLVVQRHYQSSGVEDPSEFAMPGYGTLRLIYDSDREIAKLKWPDGGIYMFVVANGIGTSNDADKGTLTQTPGGWDYLTASGKLYQFTSGGSLITQQQPGGQSKIITYHESGPGLG